MKILSIGNSFSQDAQRWLHDIAVSDGYPLECANIFVHDAQTFDYQWNDMKTHTEDNDYEVNGQHVQENVAIEDILKLPGWDIVTMQQVSDFSGRPQTYVPFVQWMAQRVRTFVPNAKLYIHQTWSYQNGEGSESFEQYHRDSGEMYRRIKDAAETAAILVGANVIPVGDVIQRLREETEEFNYQAGGRVLCRDDRHLSCLYGRFAAAAVWYETLTGHDVRSCNFIPACEEEGEGNGDPALLRIILEKAHDVCHPSAAI